MFEQLPTAPLRHTGLHIEGSVSKRFEPVRKAFNHCRIYARARFVISVVAT